MQLLAPGKGLNSPAEHNPEHVLDEIPGVNPKLPAAHSVHETRPGDDEKRPAGHSEQPSVDEDGPILPAGQAVQVVLGVPEMPLDVDENMPGSH